MVGRLPGAVVLLVVGFFCLLAPQATTSLRLKAQEQAATAAPSPPSAKTSIHDDDDLLVTVLDSSFLRHRARERPREATEDEWGAARSLLQVQEHSDIAAVTGLLLGKTGRAKKSLVGEQQASIWDSLLVTPYVAFALVEGVSGGRTVPCLAALGIASMW